MVVLGYQALLAIFIDRVSVHKLQLYLCLEAVFAPKKIICNQVHLCKLFVF